MKTLTFTHLFAGALLATTAWTSAHAAEPAAGAEIERGRYLATAGDCIACHTAPGGKPMAGGLALASPMGPIYSTNITPSKTQGIGSYTLEQFTAALRHGKRADGDRRAFAPHHPGRRRHPQGDQPPPPPGKRPRGRRHRR